jgi:hypothetical protein
MTGKNVVWLIVYYLVAAAFVWLMSQDAPLSVVLWYRIHRAAYRLDRYAKAHYYNELEKTRNG